MEDARARNHVPSMTNLRENGMNFQNGGLPFEPGTADVSLISSLIQQNEMLTLKVSDSIKEESEKKSSVENLKLQMKTMQSRLDDLDKESEEIAHSMAASKGNRTSEEIQNLLGTYDRLKLDEKQFKEMCNEELERLQRLAVQAADDMCAPPGEIEAQLQRARTRLEGGKIELGAVNRQLALMKRQIEQVPSRIELREYRLRFTELYNQVSATHRQTKQFFSLYNSLEDTKRNLEKELSLLNSIIDSYHQVCQSGSGRVDFLNQLSALHEGMKEACNKVDKRHQNERFSVDKLQHELQRLLDQRVSYEKCLKELEMECKSNDKLVATLKAKEASQ